MANKYSDSDGNKWTTDQIDRKVTKAKEQLVQDCLDEHGYVFCHTCQRNDCKPVDCAHLISVKECKETGQSELAWDWQNNMILEGRSCHARRDKLDVQFGS